MDLNRILLWIILLGMPVTIVRLLLARSSALRGWIVASAVVLGVTVACLFLIPGQAGLVGGAAWFLLVLLPSFGTRFVLRLSAAQEYRKARAVALVMRWLHPASGWREQAGIFRALALADEGAFDRAIEILQAYRSSKSRVSGAAAYLLFRLSNDWEKFNEWFGESPDGLDPRRSPDFLMTRFRALGETGDLNRMLQLYAQHESWINSPTMVAHRDLYRLMAFAFCGMRREVERLFDSSLKAYQADSKSFWLATADLAAGSRDEALSRFTALGQSRSSTTRAAALRRLTHPLPVAQDVLLPETRLILERIANETVLDAEYGEDADMGQRKPYVTYAFLALNGLAFLVECAAGGSTSGTTLFRLGALHVGAVWEGGEWWRLAAATFLHYGYVHLVMNMLGLYLLGPFVERSLGTVKYAFLYLATGAGSMLTIVLLDISGILPAHTIFVGASGSIMGLIGCTGAVLLLAWRRTKSVMVWRRLRSILLVIVLQVLFDLLNPEVSLTAHSSGVAIGFILALALSLVTSRSNASRR